MIIGIGTDLLNKKRIIKLHERFGERFIKKIFSSQEFQIYGNDTAKLAKSFGAKEAFAKALGTGLGQSFRFHDVSVLRAESGKPYFMFHKPFVFKAHLSLSDEGDIILAFVVLEQSS
jgi:holo-[acyl-carrier protein] synthase